MRIQVVSDLHLEFGTTIDQVFDPPNAAKRADILVVAGDLHVGLTNTTKALLEISALFDGVPIIFVPGNHEFYHEHYRRLRGAFAIQSLALKEKGILLLDRTSVTLGNIRFIGATGWTDGSYMRFDKLIHKGNNYGMADLTAIAEFAAADGGQTWGREDIEFIEKELGRPVAKGRRSQRTPKARTVVVTHHATTPLSLADRFRGDIHNTFFINDWSPIIDRHKPDLWIHGHCHDSFDYEIFETRVVCNPCGYIRPGVAGNTRENSEYQKSLIIEV